MSMMGLLGSLLHPRGGSLGLMLFFDARVHSACDIPTLKPKPFNLFSVGGWA